ncbi:MAG: VCBS repeat-containing protein [Pirellulales bacterium]
MRRRSSTGSRRSAPKDGKVRFRPSPTRSTTIPAWYSVIAADVTGDGLPDVLVGNKKGQFVFVQEAKDGFR